MTWAFQVLLLEAKKLASYRVDFWLRLIFTAAAKIFLAYYLWEAVFHEKGVKMLGGYSLDGMIFYFVMAALVSNVVFSGIDSFASEIYDGTLTRYLLYPVSFYIYKTMAGLAYTVLAIVQVVLGALALAYLIGIPADVHLSAENMALSLLISVIAAYLYRIMQWLLELTAFWVEAIWGLQVALYFLMNFFGGGLIPLSLFPSTVQTVLNWTPFPYLISFPVNVLLGKTSATELFVSLTIMIGWSILLTMLASFIWKRGLRQYASVGI